eukprot:13658506-Alexandrium_andersonii.AAC.1
MRLGRRLRCPPVEEPRAIRQCVRKGALGQPLAVVGPRARGHHAGDLGHRRRAALLRARRRPQRGGGLA